MKKTILLSGLTLIIASCSFMQTKDGAERVPNQVTGDVGKNLNFTQPNEAQAFMAYYKTKVYCPKADFQAGKDAILADQIISTARDRKVEAGYYESDKTEIVNEYLNTYASKDEFHGTAGTYSALPIESKFSTRATTKFERAKDTIGSKIFKHISIWGAMAGDRPADKVADQSQFVLPVAFNPNLTKGQLIQMMCQDLSGCLQEVIDEPFKFNPDPSMGNIEARRAHEEMVHNNFKQENAKGIQRVQALMGCVHE